MKKTLQKRTALLRESASLPRISVEILESRTLLSRGLGYGHDLPGFVERHAAILESFAPLASSDPISQIVDINTAAQATSNPVTCDSAPTFASTPTLTSDGAEGLLAGVQAASRSSAWNIDNQGDYVLTGKIFSLDPGGSQDVTITIPGNADDLSNQTDGNSSNNTTGQKPGANGGGKGRPLLQHPTPNGAPSDGSVSGPTVGPIANPTPAQDPNSATPAVGASDATTGRQFKLDAGRDTAGNDARRGKRCAIIFRSAGEFGRECFDNDGLVVGRFECRADGIHSRITANSRALVGYTRRDYAAAARGHDPSR